ncbi:hypothetical protein RclHR1_03270003 [Rhizophagus clarus]|uniref:Protein kinase domain-containing protein n=1 Tax=Rhizophagus clarus TaxID=94130 RepID=A0A2Z6R943_9GLOM|nr:hypothetical protein RclHR1_03270003 [Rhizophagus clarus]
MLKIHWNTTFTDFGIGLYGLYGITKNPETKEFMMIMKFADKGNLRSNLILSKYFHIGNILRVNNDIESRVSDFELSGPANEKASDDKVYGLIPYSIAPEVLTADIYSLGVAMAELSYGKPLTLVICNAPIL